MRILLTGVAGGIGSTLGYYLFKKGYELTLVDNLRNGYGENLLIDAQKRTRHEQDKAILASDK